MSHQDFDIIRQTYRMLSSDVKNDSWKARIEAEDCSTGIKNVGLETRAKKGWKLRKKSGKLKDKI